MNIEKEALAGTMESSDIMVTVGPGNGSVTIDLTSSVDIYYHDAIVQVMENTIKEMGVDSVSVRAVDHGALDCTVRARVKTAIKRAMGGVEV